RAPPASVATLVATAPLLPGAEGLVVVGCASLALGELAPDEQAASTTIRAMAPKATGCVKRDMGGSFHGSGLGVRIEAPCQPPVTSTVPFMSRGWNEQS